MKKLRFFFIIAMVFLIKVMVTIAIGRPVDPLKICMGVLGVVGIGLLITLRVWSVNKELDERLKNLASIRSDIARTELIMVGSGSRALFSTERTHPNTVTPMSFINGVWVEGTPVDVASLSAATNVVVNQPSESNPQEPGPDPENRLARVLKDDYPL